MRFEMDRINHQIVRLSALGRRLRENAVEHTKSAPADEAVVDGLMRAVISRGIPAFSYVFAIERVPAHVIAALSAVSDNKYVIVLLLNIALLLLGMLVEGAAIMILAAPVLVGIAQHFGVDPVQMGVLVTLNLTIGTLTPPVGIVMFTVCSITGCRVGDFLRELAPFLASLIALLITLSMIPQIILFLPHWTSP